MMAAIALVSLGVALALAGIGGLGWIIVAARRLAASDATPDQARAAMARLVAINFAALGAAALGLALIIVGFVL